MIHVPYLSIFLVKTKDLQTVQRVDGLIENTEAHAVDSPTWESQNLDNVTTQPNTIPQRTIQSVESPELSTNEKKTSEHLSREKRAAELHELQ